MFTVLVFGLMRDEEHYSTENHNQEFPSKKQPTSGPSKEACEIKAT